MDAYKGQQRFVYIDYLGRGSHGFVHQVQDTVNNEVVAIKYILRHNNRHLQREVLNHQALSLTKHPHIVEFKEVFLTPTYAGLVLEYVPGNNLQVYLDRIEGQVLQEDAARGIFQQLMTAMDFCHQNGKVNRDIKLTNILLNTQDGTIPHLKLCDFGFSKDVKLSLPHSQVGTVLFTAPEVFHLEAGQKYDGKAVDVWSAGIVLFVAMCGAHPLLRMEDLKAGINDQLALLLQNASKANMHWPDGFVEAHPGAVDLLSRMLVPDPAERITTAQIMAHPWFQQGLPSDHALLNGKHLKAEVADVECRQSVGLVKAIMDLALTDPGIDSPPQASSARPCASRTSSSGQPMPTDAIGGSHPSTSAAAAHVMQATGHQSQKRRSRSVRQPQQRDVDIHVEQHSVGPGPSGFTLAHPQTDNYGAVRLHGDNPSGTGRVSAGPGTGPGTSRSTPVAAGFGAWSSEDLAVYQTKSKRPTPLPQPADGLITPSPHPDSRVNTPSTQADLSARQVHFDPSMFAAAPPPPELLPKVSAMSAFVQRTKVMLGMQSINRSHSQQQKQQHTVQTQVQQQQQQRQQHTAQTQGQQQQRQGTKPSLPSLLRPIWPGAPDKPGTRSPDAGMGTIPPSRSQVARRDNPQLLRRPPADETSQRMSLSGGSLLGMSMELAGLAAAQGINMQHLVPSPTQSRPSRQHTPGSSPQLMSTHNPPAVPLGGAGNMNRSSGAALGVAGTDVLPHQSGREMQTSGRPKIPPQASSRSDSQRAAEIALLTSEAPPTASHMQTASQLQPTAPHPVKKLSDVITLNAAFKQMTEALAARAAIQEDEMRRVRLALLGLAPGVTTPPVPQSATPVVQRSSPVRVRNNQPSQECRRPVREGSTPSSAVLRNSSQQQQQRAIPPLPASNGMVPVDLSVLQSTAAAGSVLRVPGLMDQPVHMPAAPAIRQTMAVAPRTMSLNPAPDVGRTQLMLAVAATVAAVNAEAERGRSLAWPQHLGSSQAGSNPGSSDITPEQHALMDFLSASMGSRDASRKPPQSTDARMGQDDQSNDLLVPVQAGSAAAAMQGSLLQSGGMEVGGASIWPPPAFTDGGAAPSLHAKANARGSDASTSGARLLMDTSRVAGTSGTGLSALGQARPRAVSAPGSERSAPDIVEDHAPGRMLLTPSVSAVDMWDGLSGLSFGALEARDPGGRMDSEQPNDSVAQLLLPNLDVLLQAATAAVQPRARSASNDE